MQNLKKEDILNENENILPRIIVKAHTNEYISRLLVSRMSRSWLLESTGTLYINNGKNATLRVGIKLVMHAYLFFPWLLLYYNLALDLPKYLE